MTWVPSFSSNLETIAVGFDFLRIFSLVCLGVAGMYISSLSSSFSLLLVRSLFRRFRSLRDFGAALWYDLERVLRNTSVSSSSSFGSYPRSKYLTLLFWNRVVFGAWLFASLWHSLAKCPGSPHL